MPFGIEHAQWCSLLVLINISLSMLNEIKMDTPTPENMLNDPVTFGFKT